MQGGLPSEQGPITIKWKDDQPPFHEAVTGPCGGSELNVSVMPSIFRSLIIIMLTAAVAALPLAGGIGNVASAASAASSMAEHGDCCDGNPCEKKKADGCGSTIGCMVKCSAMATPVLATSILGHTHNGDKANLVIKRPAFVADNPPSPPPRA